MIAHDTFHNPSAVYSLECPECEVARAHRQRELIAGLVLAEVGAAIGITQDKADELNRPSPFWFALLNMKLGEAAAAYLTSSVVELRPENVRQKLIELAAISVRFIEALDGATLFEPGEAP